MPLYICNTKGDVLGPAAKQQIAADITRIHCSVAGAPPSFVHAMFFEDAPQFAISDKTLTVRGTIRRGRDDEQKRRIADAIAVSLAENGRVRTDETHVEIRETPASWVLEGGEIMPEPGEEAAWFAAQEARRQAEA